MNFKIETRILVDSLIKVAKSTSGKKDIPILQGIFLEATNGELHFIASNGDETTSLKVQSEEQLTIVDDGKAVVHKSLVEIAKTLKTDTVTITKEKDNIRVLTDKGEFEIPGYDANAYPKVVKDENLKVILETDFHTYQKIIDKTTYCSSINSESRPILNGVHVDVSSDQIQFLATNSHVLAQKVIKYKSQEELQFTPPALPLVNSLRIFEKEDKLTLSINDNYFVVKSNNVSYHVRLLDGTFPSTERLIIRDFKGIMKLKRDEFLAALEQVKLVAAGKKTASMSLKNGTATLKANSESGKADISFSALEVEGAEEVEFFFNVSYLLNHVKAIDSENVQLGFLSGLQPLVLLGEEEDGEYKLFLPVRGA